MNRENTFMGAEVTPPVEVCVMALERVSRHERAAGQGPRKNCTLKYVKTPEGVSFGAKLEV